MLITSSMQDIAIAKAALERIKRLFSTDILREADEDLPISSVSEYADFNTISLENIHFRYPAASGSDFFVQFDKLMIHSGEIFFIVGGNGSGKSTLLKVLTGMYQPDNGVIKVDGQPVLSLSEYRSIFSGVFSDFHLFDRLYGLEAIDEGRLQDLLSQTKLSGKTYYDLEKGFSTLDLSTGQKKRLALVIAMMEDRPFFVFDEWAADQDPHFRHYFYETILPELKKKGKTIIAITHDDRYFHIADTVIRMEYGVIEKQWHPEKKQQVCSFFSDNAMAEEKKAFTLPDHKAGITKENASDIGDVSEKEPKENLIQQIFREEKGAARKIFFYLFVFCLNFVGITISIVHLPIMDKTSAVWYLAFITQLILMVITTRRLHSVYSQAVEKRITAIRINIMGQIRKTSLSTLREIGEEKLYSILTSDIRSVANTSRILLMCFQGGFRIIMIFLSISYLYLPIFIVMVFLTGIGSCIYIYNHFKMVNLFEKIEKQEKKALQLVSHLLKGFKELKLSTIKSDEFYHKSLKKNVIRLRKLKLQANRYYVNNATITYAFWKGILLVIILAAPSVELPPETLSVIVALVLTIPLRQVIDRYAQFHMAYMAIQRIFQFENKIKSLSEERMPGSRVERFAAIRYKNISFVYNVKDSAPFFIGPMTVSFKVGEIVFITGGNGSGKSTLLNTITGLYPISTGQIFVNGQKADIQSQRELFSPIFTDFHLFDRLYGMKNVDEEKLDNLLKLFKLEKKIEWIDGKFSTLDLSTGQKKRLAMLVTMMEDKPVYIFDEWAADQDPHFREYFYMTLLPTFKKQGKTVIAVTHDDRYFETADRVLHLEYGQLTEG
ncbi:MAG: ATP-binding cassette domain-containing protein [Candidatus Electrothrix sp. GM3_4]|nr:ATP-binding cassette domain-containing protein [Candidatus Electrothrix sp. GM3_4]